MRGLKEYKLKDITLKIGSGSTPTGGKESYHSSGITLVRSLNVYDFKFEYNDLAFIDEQQARKLNGVTVEQGDILLNITGASVGRCTIIPEHLLPARVNQHVSIIRTKNDLVDSKYLLYLINSAAYKNALLTIADSGATREALTKEDIENFKIEVPPLPEQQRIASILSAYDDLIENNNKRIALLEQMAEQIYKEWFVRMRFPGYENAEFEKGVPKGWEWKTIEEVTSIITRGVPPIYDDAGELLAVNQKCIRDGKLDIELCRRHSRSFPKTKQIVFGDVLVNSTGEGTLGRVAQVYFNHEKVTVDTHVTIVRPNSAINLDYFGWYLFSLQNYFAFMAVGSTNQTELSRETIKRTKIIIPQSDLQNKFSEVVRPMRFQIQNLEKQVKILKQSRDLLLPRLISGKLRVKEVRSPEGALSANDGHRPSDKKALSANDGHRPSDKKVKTITSPERA